MYYNRDDISQGINFIKSNKSKECIIYHYWFFNPGVELQDSVCNGCYDLMMLCFVFNDIAITTIKAGDSDCFFL